MLVVLACSITLNQKKLSGSMHRMNLVLDSLPHLVLGLLEIKARLKVKPKLRGGIEEARMPKRGIGANPTTLAHQCIDTRSGNAKF